MEILPEPPAERAESTPWPQWPLIRRDSTSHQEGGTRLWGVSTTAFRGERGRVRQVQCVKAGSSLALDADLVLLAMGFVGPGPTALVDRLSLAVDSRGFLTRDERHMTTTEGVFVTGDMQRGPSLVVHAIADGMQTARRVAVYLNG